MQGVTSENRNRYLYHILQHVDIMFLNLVSTTRISCKQIRRENTASYQHPEICSNSRLSNKLKKFQILINVKQLLTLYRVSLTKECGLSNCQTATYSIQSIINKGMWIIKDLECRWRRPHHTPPGDENGESRHNENGMSQNQAPLPHRHGFLGDSKETIQ